MPGNIHHISITCRNLSDTLAFYNSLGFNQKKLYHYEKYTILYPADSRDLIIEVFHFINNSHEQTNRKLSINTLGITHSAIIVNSVDKMLYALKNKGIKCSKINIAKISSYRYFFTYDPDGNAVEIIEEIK